MSKAMSLFDQKLRLLLWVYAGRSVHTHKKNKEYYVEKNTENDLLAINEIKKLMRRKK